MNVKEPKPRTFLSESLSYVEQALIVAQRQGSQPIVRGKDERLSDGYRRRTARQEYPTAKVYTDRLIAKAVKAVFMVALVAALAVILWKTGLIPKKWT